MINCSRLFQIFKENGIGFFTGVPDSLLKNICAYITDNTNDKEHIIAANEGAAVGLATGYYLATQKVPLVYFQNSGLGNSINPLLSLADQEVYGIPMVLMIGWRGEPGRKDEPQHKKQGRVQNTMLEAMEVPYIIIDAETKDLETKFGDLINTAKSLSTPVAMVVKADTFESYKLQSECHSSFEMNREEAIIELLNHLGEQAVVVSTTGKASREVFEYREAKHQGHDKDFLTVGSMGHANQIALSIALHSNKQVVCLDGDGAALMHMGSLSVIGNSGAKNFIHVLLNNGAHDSVGGQPTLGFSTNFKSIAAACNYQHIFSIEKKEEITSVMQSVLSVDGPVFIEIKINKGARNNLGRPITTPTENKNALIHFLLEDNDH